MSFVTPRSNIVTIMKNLGYKKLKDAFDFENVGNTKLEKAFHLEQGPINPSGHHQGNISLLNEMTLRFYSKGKRDTEDLMGDALVELDTICNGVLAISNRINGVTNILFGGFNAVPHSDDNDDIIRGELNLTIQQEVDFS